LGPDDHSSNSGVAVRSNMTLSGSSYSHHGEVAPEPVEIDLDWKDVQAILQATTSPSINRMGKAAWVTCRVVLVGLLFIAAERPVVLILVLAQVIYIVLGYWQRRRAKAENMRAFTSMNGSYSATSEGIIREASTNKTLFLWNGITGIRQSSEHLILILGGSGWVFPFRCFPSDEHRVEFVRFVQQRLPNLVLTR
jgi:hypothetical protein